MKVGETMKFDVTFGGILKGKADIVFLGKITSITEYETLTIPIDMAKLDTIHYCPLDSSVKTILNSFSSDENDSNNIELPESIDVVKKKDTDIYYITYDTEFIGNIYDLHAEIYMREDFYPILIETKIIRTGKTSYGKELFFPNKKKAIFMQTIGGVTESDTLIRNNPLQDITTIPFYLMRKKFSLGTTYNVSLPQGEFEINYSEGNRLEVGEGAEYRSYETYKVESNPEGFTVWLDRKTKVPVKVNMEKQKIKMILTKRLINNNIKIKSFTETEIRKKLSHIF
jgi:hypothetical protein